MSNLKVKSSGINFNVPTINDFPTEHLEDGLVCVVTDENRGGVFVYRSDNALVNNGGTIFDGWTRQYDGAVNVKWFGAKGDGVTDDTAAIQNAIFSSSYSSIPVGDYKCTLVFSDIEHKKIELQKGAVLIPNLLTHPVITLTNCNNVSIVGGSIISTTHLSRYISIVSGFQNIIDGVNISNVTESIDTTIYYTSGAVVIQGGKLNVVQNCELKNMEGCGVSLYAGSEKNTIKNNYIVGNTTGIINSDDTTNHNLFIDNIIAFNNTSNLSGADGILVNATSIEVASRGHIVSGNMIYNSGEHGIYFQASDSVISNNVVYGNTAGGIKIAKCRNVTIDSNTLYSNDSNIQVQSGYDIITISNNVCRNATRQDLDFTWSLAQDVFGGKGVTVTGNRFESIGQSSAYSIDASGTANMMINNNYLARGMICTYIGGNTQDTYIIDNNIIDGLLAISGFTGDSKITNNVLGNYNGQETGQDSITFDNNVVRDLTMSSRKAVNLNQYKSFCGNKIYTTQAGGAPIYELINGQNASTDNIRFSGNYIEVADPTLIILNTNNAGINVSNSVISDNVFKGATTAFNMLQITGCVVNGNVGLTGTIYNCATSIITSNTGAATFSNATTSVVANNI